MKAYTPPALAEYGSAAQITADSRNNSIDDTFTNVNGDPEAGLGGSNDTCTTLNQEDCAA